MKKAGVYAKSGRIGDGEKRALELWMTSLQTTPVKAASKERVFELAKALATDEHAWTMELDSFSAGMITTFAEGPSSAELKVTGTSRKKMYAIRQRPADMQRLAEVRWARAAGRGAAQEPPLALQVGAVGGQMRPSGAAAAPH